MKAIYIVCVIALMGAMMMVTPASATTWYVHDGESIYDYTGYSGAHWGEVSSGDTIFVYNGSYGVFYIDKPNLKVIGEGADVVTADFGGARSIRMPDSMGDATGSVLEGITVVNSESGVKVGNFGSASNCIIRDCVFEGLTSDYGVEINANNVTFENNVISNATGPYGALYITNSSNSCTIANNTITDNVGAGIFTCCGEPGGGNNIITGNNICSNELAGFCLYEAASGNKIYLNNIVDNGVTATTFGSAPPSVTYWNSTEPIDYTYGGSPYTNYLGNNWSDYGGTDGNGDGIGDTDYVVPDSLGSDFRPLIAPFENYPVSEPTPPDSLEFGDAPDPTHPSLLSSDGARHTPTDTEFLGLQSTGDGKDFEPNANVPDADLLDDGLLTFALTTGDPAQTVDFEVTNNISDDQTLIVNILLDLNGDGDWNDPGEHVVQNQPIPLTGIAEGTFTSTPFSTVGATPGLAWMRITLTRHTINTGWDGTMASAGYAEPFGCGETEDWLVELQELVPPTPFLISGEVNYGTGDPVPDPAVTVLNTNTSESFAVNISGNAYQVTTDSTHVGAGNVLHFNASNGNVTEFNRTVISDDMNAGGFVQNITIVQPVVPLPDLIVESVSINPSCKHYYFANEPNVLDVTVKNIGDIAAGASNASVSGASGTSAAPVGALNSGESQTVTITDTVARPAGEVVTATADCYGEVAEGDETNNASSIIDPDGNNYVINHGFKGKWLAEGYAGPDPGNMTTWKSYELHGDLNYSVGDSYYLSGYTPWEHYTASWTADDLPISDGATLVEARLYVYYTWDKAFVMPDNVSTSFNGVNQDYDVHYTDRRGYGSMGSYNLPYGALVYNVTDDFDTTGNHANVTKLILPKNQVSMRGMMLVVVYEDPTEPLRQIFVTEEYDNLYGKASYCTTPEEATARALFTGPSIDMGTMVNANLVTVAPGASPNEGDLIFNGQVWTDVWNFAGTNGAELGIDERDVTTYLESTDNAVGFRSSGDWMEASNAFLVVEYEEIVEEPDLIVESVSINPSCKHYYFANEPNVLDVTVKNIGTAAAGASNASVSGASGTSAAPVGALNSGQSQTVTITDPVARPAGEVVTATADCYGEVAESDETNNASSIIDPDGNNYVINHGFKGKWLAEGYAGPDPGNMTTWKSYELHGDLNYSVGDSYYLSGYANWGTYNASWTAFDLPISSGATVKEARLYVYYTWDKACVMPDNVSTSFNGVNQDYDVHYTDRRGYGSMGSYNLPYGALVYNVTDDFDTTGNHANVTKLILPKNQVSMRGMMLVVVYEDPTEPLRQIFVTEEYDNLYGKASYCTTPEEATARALFTGPSIDMGTMVNANLVTVAPGASPNEGDLIFNGQVWTDVWNFAGTNGAELGIDERDVTTYLESTDNAVGFRSSGDWMEASNAFLVVEYEEEAPEEAPDLIVSAIKPNCGYLFGNESNEICATIENIGNENAGAFNVSFVVDGFSEEVQIGGLAAGASTEECIIDTTLRSAGDAVTITVTADCNAEVDESDETNNALTLDTTVVNNGYKGKTYTGGEDITTLATYDINGNLVYSVGDSYYLSSYSYPDWTNYDVSWAASDLPVTGTVIEARLYVPYTWDKKEVMPTYASLSFNGAAQTLDAHYSDEKGWATSYPYGMLVYDVTGDFDASGNVANLTNSCPGGGGTSMRGMLLVAVYENASEPRRLIYVNEEFDLLYGGSGKCTTPEEATAWAPITGPSIDTAAVANAILITVAPGASPDEGELIFNGQVWTDVWNFAGTNGAQIGIDERDVKDNLTETDNLVGFQSSGDYMEASNVFLVVELKIPAGVTIKPETLNLKSKGKFTAFITLPEGYDVADINVSTVECEGAQAIAKDKKDKKPGKGKDELKVKFKVQDLVDVPIGDEVEMTVTGELFDGTVFEGSDLVRVIEKGKK